MSNFSGSIKFISSNGDQALVEQTLLTSTFKDGFRFLRNATFGARAVNDSINYTYVGGFAREDNWITIP